MAAPTTPENSTTLTDVTGPVHCAYAVQVRWTVEGEPDRLVGGNRPLHKRETKPEIKVPTCPAHLRPPARAEWKRLIGELFVLGVVTALDRAALAAYRQAYGRWAEAERKLKDTPVLIKLPSGYIQPSPWLAIANRQLELMAKDMAELGLSLVSRTRVEARPPCQRKSWEFGREWVEPRSSPQGSSGPTRTTPPRSTSGEKRRAPRSRPGGCKFRRAAEPSCAPAHKATLHPSILAACQRR